MLQRVYLPIGFKKAYNFFLWFVFAGAMMGFVLARFFYLDYSGVYCSPNASGGNGAAPGECYSYSTAEYYEVGIKLHLYTIIPASFLAVFQFTPAIRLRLTLVHRLNGYVVLMLSVAGQVGALMMARIAFGGGIEIQALVGLLTIMFLGSLALAIYNIKRLQIEQHRAWMLRAWFYAGSIITSRFIMIIAAMVITSSDAYYKAWPCAKIASFHDDTDEFLRLYPACEASNAWAPVRATMNGDGAENVGAALNVTFGMALWVALSLHAFGVELYVRTLIHLFVNELRLIPHSFTSRPLNSSACDTSPISASWLQSFRIQEDPVSHLIA